MDIREINPGLSGEQIEKLKRLEEIYKRINAEINVISRKDIGNVMAHHIVPALLIGKVAGFGKGRSVLDIGTGGGLPGLPLAIIFPQSDFTLIDSIAKKIKAVQMIIRELGLKNAIALQKRSNECKDRFDYVVGRGVTEASQFFILAQKNLNDPQKGNTVFYISGECEKELPRIELSSLATGEYYDKKYIYTNKH